VFQRRVLREREASRLEERLARVPNDWDAKARLVDLYLESGKRGLAILIYRQLKDGRPDHPRLPELTRLLNPRVIPPFPAELTIGGHGSSAPSP